MQNYVELRGLQRELDVTRSLPDKGRSQHSCYGAESSYAFPDSEGHVDAGARRQRQLWQIRDTGLRCFCAPYCRYWDIAKRAVCHIGKPRPAVQYVKVTNVERTFTHARRLSSNSGAMFVGPHW